MKRRLRSSIRRHLRPAVAISLLLALGAAAWWVGLHLAGVGLLAAALLGAAAYAALVMRPARIPRAAILELRLAGALREVAPRRAFERIMGRGLPSLHELRQALEAAAADPMVSAVMVEIADLQVGLAAAQELHDLLAAARRAGKRVVALLTGDSVGARQYLVACGAGEIVANPDCLVTLLGVAAGSVFVKGALDRLGIEAQILQWKEYKGAAESFTREAMSAALRESLEAIIADWQEVLTGAIAQSRKLTLERARELINGGFASTALACASGLVDRAGYAEELRRELEPGDKQRRFVQLGRYLHRVEYLARGARRARLALIHGVGPVIGGAGPAVGEFLSAAATARNIELAARDKRVRAIVFRVNSPGGSAVGSDLVWRAVREARERGKPVVASMGDVAGSGGYYVAMGADAIVAEPATITGSIGVVWAKFNLGSLLARLGVRADYAKSGAPADALSPFRALSEAELGQLDAVLGELYANFTAKAAACRKLDAQRAEQSARGRVWSGTAARSIGLVDELGGLGRAVAIAREKAGIAPGLAHELVQYPGVRRWSWLRPMWAQAGEAGAAAALLAQAAGIPEPWLMALLQLAAQGAPLLLCPIF